MKRGSTMTAGIGWFPGSVFPASGVVTSLYYCPCVRSWVEGPPGLPAPHAHQGDPGKKHQRPFK